MVIEGDIETMLEAESDAEGLDEIEREHYEQIKSLNILVGEAAYIHDIKKHEAKAAKDHWEGLQLRLSSLISEGPTKPDPQLELSFPEWQEVSIEDVLKLTQKQAEKLLEIGVKTVGHFEDLRAGKIDGYPNGLLSVKGFGEKTIDAMENDIVEWLSKNARETESSESDND